MTSLLSLSLSLSLQPLLPLSALLLQTFYLLQSPSLFSNIFSKFLTHSQVPTRLLFIFFYAEFCTRSFFSLQFVLKHYLSLTPKSTLISLCRDSLVTIIITNFSLISLHRYFSSHSDFNLKP